MSGKVLRDAFEILEKAKSSNELRAEMETFAKQMGFEHFTYALTVKVPSLKFHHYFISGYPQKWADRYLAQGYLQVDPLVRHAESSTLPVVWGDELLGDAKSQEFWEEARAFGLNAGLTFAVHEQPGVTGMFSLARDRILDFQGQDLAALIGRAQMFASILHHAVCRIDLPKMLPEASTNLTARERECLRWAAEGKTTWETGQILNITERTAVFHVNNAAQKLGATNKVQAIVRALALKLI